MDMKNKIIDEIALSGLQGLTIPKLWQCLMGTEPPLLKNDSDEELKNFLWSSILRCEEVEFFWYNPENAKKSPEKKKKKKKSPENAVKGDPNDSCGGAKLPKDWISDPENEICGYCPGYYTRENITTEVHEMKMTYSEIYSRWQDSLVLVGSQALRRNALYGNRVSDDVAMTDLRFIFLELVGMGRHHGFYQKDFKHYSMDARSTFHQIKILSQQGLVTRQKFQMKSENDNNIQTNILFLTRFHKSLSSDNEIYTHKLCDILSKEPGCVMEFAQLKQAVDCPNKLFKRIRANLYTNGNIQYIQKDQIFNYSDGQKSLFSKFVWSQPILVQLIKGLKTADVDDDDDDEGNYVSQCKYVNPQIVNEVHLNQQMYWLIESSKNNGMTVHEFGATSCMPYHMVRSFSRQLDRKNLAKVIITDKSRQKVHTLIAANHLHQSEVVRQINVEFDRAEDLAHNSMEADDTKDKSLILENSTDRDESSQTIKLEDKGSRQFIKNLELKPVNERKNDTVRGMKRQNIIMEKIKELRIIEGPNPIYKTVAFQEQQQGIKEKVCRKSVQRILKRMVDENLVKKYEVVIKNAENKANCIYYCDPNVTMEDEEFRTAVDETKFRLKGIVSRREVKEGKVKENFVKNQGEDVKPPTNVSLLDYVSVNTGTGNESDTDDEEYEPVSGSAYQRSQYGYLPRFPRLKTLQMYLWQLVYGNQEDAASCKEEHEREYYNDRRDDEGNNDWRFERYDWLTELVKLPANRNGAGYFQTGDALAIMPIVIFTKCVGICLKSKTLDKMLNHPKKRFTPLRDLPPKLKTKLFKNKNVGYYVGHFIDALVLLTHLGLLYITPERLPANRTQIVMLVSKEAMLVDTTQSEKGYSKTTLPPELKSFPKLYYRFESLASIEKYWKDVQYVCLNTRLGMVAQTKKSAEEKKSKPNRSLMTLRQFQEHFPLEDLENTKARLFGDGLGAGGFDSTFFGHLAKNWTFPGSKSKVLCKPAEIEESTAASKILPSRFSMPFGGFKKVVRSSVAVKASIGGRGKKRSRIFDNKIVTGAASAKKVKNETNNPDDLKLKKIMAARYRQKLAKLKTKTPQNRSHRSTNDATDLEAKKRMKAFRVNFTPTEDAAILMFRITAELLNLDKRKLNYWPIARDILHLENDDAHDKTITSLARRGRNILKNALTVENMKSCVLECRADKNLDTKSPVVEGDAWKDKFKELYEKVKEKYKSRLEPDEFTFAIPETLLELRKSFNINKAFEKRSAKKPAPSQPTSSKDIDILVLEELIHNSLAGQNTKEYMPSLVFRIFDRYPAGYLEKALFSMKAKSLVAKLRVNVPRRRALPISTMSYSLSLAYERLFEMPLSPHLFPAAKSFLKMIRDGKKHDETKLDHKEEISRKENVKENTADKQLSDEKDKEKTGSEKASKSVSHPGSIVYSREEALGGHIACLLSLLMNDKAFVQLAIPDNVVQCDPETIEKLEQSDDIFSNRTITVMKRKMYAVIEDALEKEEDKVMEDLDDEDDQVIGGNDSDSQDDKELFIDNKAKSSLMEKEQKREMNDALRTSAEKSKTEYSKKFTDISLQDVLVFPDKARKDVSESRGSFQIMASTSKIEKPNLESEKGESSTKAIDVGEKRKSSLLVKDIDLGHLWGNGDESAIPKKKHRVTFEADKCDGEKSTDAKTHSLKRKRNDDMSSNDDNALKKTKLAGAINFQTKGKLISTSFFSNKRLIHRYIDSFTNPRNLKTDFIYISTSDESGVKPGIDVVPSKAFELKKSKLYTSRTTLMLHRSFNDEKAHHLNTKNLTAHEALSVNPLEITCHLHLRPFHKDVLDQLGGSILNDENSEDFENAAVSNTDDTQSMLDRFRNREEILYTEREIDCGLDALPEEDFCSFMTDKFGWNDNEIEFAKEVLKGLRQNKELGLTEADVEEIYKAYINLRPIDELTVMMINFKVAYCVGMHTKRYVSPLYVRGWSINAPLSKGGEEEVIDVIAKNQLEAEVAKMKREKKQNFACSGENEKQESNDATKENGGNDVDNSTAARKKTRQVVVATSIQMQSGRAVGDVVSAKTQTGHDVGDAAVGTTQTGYDVGDKAVARKQAESEIADAAASQNPEAVDAKDVLVARKQKENGEEDVALASKHNDVGVISQKKSASQEHPSDANTTENVSHLHCDYQDRQELVDVENLKNSAAKPILKDLEFQESLRSCQSIVHITSSTKTKGAAPNQKPVATIVKVNKTMNKERKTLASTKAVIGFEASDGSDEELMVDGRKGNESSMRHVLGPTSTKTELRYKRMTCKPWLKLNCEVNQTLFRKFHRAVLSFIMMCPGITESAIYTHFKSVLRPIALKDILQFLELNGCVSKHFSRQKKRPSLFDPVEKIIETDFMYDDPYFLPTENCVLNIADNS